MKNKPKISFLVTYYNQKEYVKDSLESILNLTIPCEYEVLVGDDGSDDGTFDEVLKYSTKFNECLRIFKQSRDDGVLDNIIRASNLRKRLLQESRGEYFMTLDGDDFYCDKEFLKDALEILENNSNISVVMFDYEKLYTDKIIKCKLNMQSGIHDCNDYVRNHYSHAGACVLRTPNRIAMKNINSGLYYDDNVIVIFQLNFGNIWYIDKCIYSYRQTSTSIYLSLSRVESILWHIFETVGCLFLSPKLKDDIYIRNRWAILYIYFRRETIRYMVGDKYYKNKLKLAIDNDIFLVKNLLLPKSDAISENETKKIINIIKEYDPKYYQNAKKSSEKFNNIYKQIPPNKNIIIYGAGMMGKSYYNEFGDSKYFNNILWVDKNYKIYKNLGVKSIECLKAAKDYDYIIIAINDKNIANDVMNYLSNISALSNTKFIWNLE